MGTKGSTKVDSCRLYVAFAWHWCKFGDHLGIVEWASFGAQWPGLSQLASRCHVDVQAGAATGPAAAPPGSRQAAAALAGQQHDPRLRLHRQLQVQRAGCCVEASQVAPRLAAQPAVPQAALLAQPASLANPQAAELQHQAVAVVTVL